MRLESCVGVIGGSGLYEMDGLTDIETFDVLTPFGRPSDSLIEGRLSGKKIVFLPRHGRGHRLLPSEINSRANIWALKSRGVTHLISVSAVGSLCEDFHPGDVVVPDSIIDRTSKTRPHSFFGQGIAGHIGFADPFCPELRAILLDGIVTSGAKVRAHEGGTYLCIEGPRFSTRAESHLYRQWGAKIIGMTAMPEAVLAREAEIAYGTLGFVTDYDCWHETHDAVSVSSVLEVLQRNSEAARTIVQTVVDLIPSDSENPIFEAAKHAIMTKAEHISVETKRSLNLLYGRYWGS